MIFSPKVQIIESCQDRDMVLHVFVFLEFMDGAIFTAKKVNDDLIAFLPSVWAV